jgi:uncharacterized protein
MLYEPRVYRESMVSDRFRSFTIVLGETDMWIGVSPSSYNDSLIQFCKEKVNYYRYLIKNYLIILPEFGVSHKPVSLIGFPDPIIVKMAESAKAAGTGPMAAVAGAIAEFLGMDIVREYNPEELIIENGGDIFVSVSKELNVKFFAGENTQFNKLHLQIPAAYPNLGICTSSGTFGHSLSYGCADSVTVVCPSAALADAWATSVCNMIKKKEDILRVIDYVKDIPDVLSVIIIKDDEIGISGRFLLGVSAFTPKPPKGGL